jgi:uncharacterized protein YndB with AHSA1/START domain
MTLDIGREVGLVTREVQNREHAGRPARVVLASRDYDTSVEDLWDAVTSAERIPRWFLPITGDLRLGGRYQLQGNAGGTISACEPPRHLALTWEFGGEVTWVEVRLGAAPYGGTRLELEHIAHVDDTRWGEFGPGAVGVGWDLSLFGLGLYIASGVSQDPARVTEWMASAECKALMRGSSDDWCRAAIVAGAERSHAHAAAARTIAAYTGEPPQGGEGPRAE